MVNNRKNSFEFIGYDFMVDEDLKVWLIEVNSSPSMDTKSQPVLQRLCKSVLHDLAKIVVDLKKDKKADKGDFEIVHRAKFEVMRPKNLNMNSELKIDGRKIRRDTEFELISHSQPQMGVRNAKQQ